jgi:hypothetical protein
MSFCFQDILITKQIVDMLKDSDLSMVNVPVSEPYSVFKKKGWIP